MRKSIRFLDSNMLRALACILMLCDHMWATIVPGNEWLTWIGRLAFPIFAFHQNVMFTLLLGLLAVKALNNAKEKHTVKAGLVGALLAALCCLGAAITFTDYGALGVATVIMFYLPGSSFRSPPSVIPSSFGFTHSIRCIFSCFICCLPMHRRFSDSTIFSLFPLPVGRHDFLFSRELR